MAQWAATGISDRPMMVITQPLTSGGKNRVSLEKMGAMIRPNTEAKSTAPSTPCMPPPVRSEEHTSELQSPCNLVCRLLLEKKKKKHILPPSHYQIRHYNHSYTHCTT